MSGQISGKHPFICINVRDMEIFKCKTEEFFLLFKAAAKLFRIGMLFADKERCFNEKITFQCCKHCLKIFFCQWGLCLFIYNSPSGTVFPNNYHIISKETFQCSFYFRLIGTMSGNLELNKAAVCV